MSNPGHPSSGRFGVVRNVARWLFGAPMVTVRHLRFLHHLDRVTTDVAVLSEVAPGQEGQTAARPEQHSDPALQTEGEGLGPLVMRTYAVDIRRPRIDGPTLIAKLIAEPNRFSPNAIASFMRDDRSASDLRVDDELVVELPGPWNGPVRVQRADDTLLLLTLDGHMEAGRIRFDTQPLPDGFRFRIRSWARAGDRPFLVLHVVTKLAWEMQTAMWVEMCRRAVDVSGGSRSGQVRVHTEILRGSSQTVGDPA